MTFQIEFSSISEKFLRKAQEDIRNRIFDKIKQLKEDPFLHDSKRVIGKEEKVFRVRVGDYRILYVVYFDEKSILIFDIGRRERIY